MNAYWEAKGKFEKIFWVLFAFLVLFFFFFHFGFEGYYKRYIDTKRAIKLASKAPIEKKEKLLSPSEVIQRILKKDPEIKIVEFSPNKDGVVMIVAEGNFKNLSDWLYFIENFKQNKIVDFKFLQDIKMYLEVSFEILFWE